MHVLLDFGPQVVRQPHLSQHVQHVPQEAALPRVAQHQLQLNVRQAITVR